MSSSEIALTDLEKDLPTTAEDVAALRAIRSEPEQRPFAVLQALADALPEAARRQKRPTSAGWPEFTL
jgi:hypothetical protein